MAAGPRKCRKCGHPNHDGEICKTVASTGFYHGRLEENVPCNCFVEAEESDEKEEKENQ